MVEQGVDGKGDGLAVGFCHAGVPAVDVDTGDTGADDYERHLGDCDWFKEGTAIGFGGVQE